MAYDGDPEQWQPPPRPQQCGWCNGTGIIRLCGFSLISGMPFDQLACWVCHGTGEDPEG